MVLQPNEGLVCGGNLANRWLENLSDPVDLTSLLASRGYAFNVAFKHSADEHWGAPPCKRWKCRFWYAARVTVAKLTN